VRSRSTPWVWVGLAALLLTAADCGSKKPGRPADGGTGADSSADQTADGGPLRACLDSPSTLPRPPAATLPCELIPPGLVL